MNPEDLEVTGFPRDDSGVGVHRMPVGVTVLHKPTGLSVSYDKKRSQHGNRDEAIRRLTISVAKHYSLVTHTPAPMR